MKCKWCGKDFIRKRHDQKFCSRDCTYFYSNIKGNLASYIKTISRKYDFRLENLDKIINAKIMMFAKDNPKRCPCDANNPDRFCGSARCIADTVYHGHCCCRLFWSKKEPLLEEKEK